MSSACSNLVPWSSLEIPANELVQRLGWMQITIQENDREETSSYPWPGICYQNYGEFIAHVGREMSQERKCKIALRQLTGGLECMHNPVAHLLGRPDFDVVELGSGVKPQMDIQEFMLSMPSIVNPVRVKAAFLPRHPNYFLDFHRGLDEAIAILTEVTGASCAPTVGKWLQEATSVLHATNDSAEIQTDVATPTTAAEKSPSLGGDKEANGDKPSTQEPRFSENEEEIPLEMRAMQDEEISHSDSDMKSSLLTQPEEEEDIDVNDPKIYDPVIPATSEKPQEEPTSTTPLGNKKEGVGGIDADPSDPSCVDASPNYEDETSPPDGTVAMVTDTASAAQSKSQGNVMKMNSQPSSPVSVCESTGSATRQTRKKATRSPKSQEAVTPKPTKRSSRTPQKASKYSKVEKDAPKHAKAPTKHVVRVERPFFQFKTLMPLLQKLGWKYARSSNRLKDWSYVLPGCCPRTGKYCKDLFHEEDEVVEYVKERPELVQRLKCLMLEKETSDADGGVQGAHGEIDEASQQGTSAAMVTDPVLVGQPASQASVQKMTSSSDSLQSNSPRAPSQPSSPTVVSVCDSAGSTAKGASTEVSELAAKWEDPGIDPFSDWDTAFQNLEYEGWTRVISGEIIPPGGVRDGVKGRDFFDEEGAKELIQRLWGWKGPREGLKAARTPKKTTGKRAATTPQQSPFSLTPLPGSKRIRRSPSKFSDDKSVEKATPAKVVDPFFNFKTLIPLLVRLEWQYKSSPNPLKTFCYVLPGRSAKTGVYGEDFFYEEDEVVDYVRRTKGLAKALKDLSTVASQNKDSSLLDEAKCK